MSQRTFTLTGTCTDFSGSPIANAPCSFQPIVPGNLEAVDGNGKFVQTKPVAFNTDGSGAFSVTVDYPGDFQTAYVNTQVRATINGVVTDSPIGFAYASSIALTSWINAPVTTGLVTMRAVYTTDGNAGIGGTTGSVVLSSPATVVASGQILSSTVPTQAISAGDGTMLFSLNPNSLLNPSNLGYSLTIDGEFTTWSFIVPAVVDVYRGAWNSITAYAAASGSSNGDVVTNAGVLYRCILGNTNQAPPNGTYWQVVSGLPTDMIAAHLTAVTSPGSVAIGPGGVSHSTDVPAIAGDPVPTPSTLADDLANLVHRIAGGVGGASSVATPRTRIWPQAVSALTPSAGTPVSVISDGRFNSFPDLAVTRSGKLIAAYGDVTSEVSTDGITTIQTSTDGGATWSVKRALFSSGGGHAYYGANIVCTATGRLLLDMMDQPGGSGIPGYIDTSISDDDGATWSALVQLSLYTTATYCTGNTLQHSSGVLIKPVYGKNTGDTGFRNGVIRSLTDGTTWGTLINVGAANSNYTEASLIELPNHTIRAYIRHEGATTNNLYISESTDQGQTWSTPVILSAFNVYPGKPCAVLVPVSQLLVLFYRSTTSEHAVYRYSSDLGATWSAEQLYSSNVYTYAGGCALSDTSIGFIISASTSGTVAALTYEVFTAGSTGVGTVSTVSVTVPADETATVTNPTTTPVVAITRNNYAQGTFLGGPTSGAPAPGSPRTLVSSDTPIASYSQRGSVIPDGSTITVDAAGRITAAASGSTLASLSDATITSPVEGDYLIYKSGKWRNIDPTLPGGGAVYWTPLTDSGGGLITASDGSVIMMPAAV